MGLPRRERIEKSHLVPAVEEINEKTGITVLFSEEKQNGTKTVVGLNSGSGEIFKTPGRSKNSNSKERIHPKWSFV